MKYFIGRIIDYYLDTGCRIYEIGNEVRRLNYESMVNRTKLVVYAEIINRGRTIYMDRDRNIVCTMVMLEC